MKKIIVHLGLPKTATTTLQHHLFQNLHEQGKINYLGKIIDFDPNTGQPTFRNNKGGVIRAACEGKLAGDSSDELDHLLDEQLVNVYSDEGIMVCYPFEENISLSEKILNLKEFLKDYDVTILVSLRNQVDYFYSLYIQFFSQYFKFNKDYNSFEKYSELYLKNKKDMLFESFDYSNVLVNLFENFNTKVIIFEDLKHDSAQYYDDLSKLFSVELTEIKDLMEDKHENSKNNSKTGTYTSFSLASFLPRIKEICSKNQKLYDLSKRIFNAEILNLKFLFNRKINAFDKHHKKPSANELARLEKHLLFPESFTASRYNLCKDKLVKYGYMQKNITEPEE
ncbi:hypothetical protein [Thalassotalea sp. ND16A]|uniref:hypothetical protein n=1 Tax=Thalassotalea sp. ND16A TaxID=1535422 RepID=UPI000519F08E|nr:hypothetical protein [Thalassotalea sp. ND16A]KGJ90195.1 hypothetical protein ND16A_2045 [Thalassotalea sp. ND16A]